MSRGGWTARDRAHLLRGCVGVGVAAAVTFVPALPALAAAGGAGGPLDLGGVPAVGLLRAGRVLVLRPNRLEVVLDGRLVRTVAVRQPVDLAQLPALAGDPAYAAALPASGTGTGTGVRLGAVLAQRPGTAVTAVNLSLRLGDTGGAGPARLTGTRARLTLRGARIDADAGVPASPPAAPGFRYLHGSNVSMDGVTMSGLGATGSAVVPAVRADGGSALALRHLSLVAGGPGVEVRDPAWLAVDGLDGRRVGGPLLTVSGGTGARIRDVTSHGASGPAVRLRGTGATTVEGLDSTGDSAALVAQDVDGVRAGRLRARGDGIVLGGRDLELSDVDVDAPVDGLRVASGAAVVVRGGSLGGKAAAVDAAPGGRARLDGVRTAGALRGAVDAAPSDGADRSARPVPWWDRPVRGAGAVALVVLVAGVFLEVLRGRRRGHGERTAGGRDRGSAGGGADGESGAGGLPGLAETGDLALDLGERRVH